MLTVGMIQNDLNKRLAGIAASSATRYVDARHEIDDYIKTVAIFVTDRTSIVQENEKSYTVSIKENDTGKVFIIRLDDKGAQGLQLEVKAK